MELAGVLATLLGAVIALSPAVQAAEPFCRPQPPEPPLTRIQEYQEMRKLYGLRTDPAITKRTDTARFLRGRYGPRVRTRVVATELFSPRCRNLIDQVADGTRLTIGWQAGGTVELDHIEVAEYDDRVEIGVVVQSYNGAQPADWRRADAVVELSRPLGEREVVDATTGRLVPRRARRVLRKSRPDRGRRRPSRAPHGSVREYRRIFLGLGWRSGDVSAPSSGRAGVFQAPPREPRRPLPVPSPRRPRA